MSCSLIPFVLELLNLKMIQNPNNVNSFTFTQTMDRKLDFKNQTQLYIEMIKQKTFGKWVKLKVFLTRIHV